MPTNQVSIDRITVSGELKAEYRELQRVMNALGSSWELSDGVFRLIREYPNGDTENIAYYAENAFQAGSWRLDFNPNKLTDEEKLEMKRAIDLLTDVHFTRLDLAFDVFNNELGMKYRIYRPNVSQREYGVYTAQWTKAVETIYYGSNSSEQQIRQYNKLVEQTKKNMPLPDGVEHWMRLELQLRGRKPAEWVDCAKSMLADFRLPNYDNIKSVNDKLALAGLDSQLVDWSDFAKEKRARLRKLQKEQYDDTLARELFNLLIAHQERLRGELTSYLAELDIQEQSAACGDKGQLLATACEAGCPFRNKTTQNCPRQKKLLHFFGCPTASDQVVKRTSLVGVGETHGLKKGINILLIPFFSLSETNSDTFFKHKNRPILEWCVSAHCHEK